MESPVNTLARLLVAATLCSTAALPAAAEEYTQGFVKKIDQKQHKVTVRHGEIKNLDMPAMTMVFRVADDAMLDGLEEGQTIEFIADRLSGKLTIVEIK
jgi:Cu/Ag efflux protein CusF